VSSSKDEPEILHIPLDCFAPGHPIGDALLSLNNATQKNCLGWSATVFPTSSGGRGLHFGLARLMRYCSPSTNTRIMTAQISIGPRNTFQISYT
jgi:hypothetical protein